MEKSLVLASNNKGKLREFQAIFAELGVDVINQGALGVEACPEPFGTFIENCLAKARHASKMTGRPAMADDSGVCVNALNGMPGVLSARFAGEPSNDEANNRLLVERLQGKDDRRAHYTCVLTAVRTPDDPEPLVAVGRWYGEICDEPAGEGGFGYDPVFMPDGYSDSMAVLGSEVKNKISHRAHALEKFRTELRRINGTDK